MGKLFGTDGIRGVANVYPMDPETILKIGRACTYVLKNKERSRIVLGRDTRISGSMIENALVAGLASMGVICLKVGVLPTPAIAYLVKKLNCEAGIVISASHNPMIDNGIKIIGSDGLKLLDELEEKIENNIENKEIKRKIIGKDIGYEEEVRNAKDLYKQFLMSIFKIENLNSMKIVIDCAHGATSLIAPEIFEELGAKVISINNLPDGTNINLNCGSLYPEIVSKAVLEHNADIGISFDGDGDRLIAVDEKGSIIDGDFIMLICAHYLKEENKLKNNLLVITQMSNFGLEKALKELGIDFVRTDVGDRYVIREMIHRDAIIGGEQSGHIIFKNISNTGDGIISALKLIEVMLNKNKPLSKLANLMKRYPQVLLNTKVREKRNFEEIPEIKKAIQEGKTRISHGGRILTRYSGTEFLARVMVEGSNEEEIMEIAKNISGAIERCLGI